MEVRRIGMSRRDTNELVGGGGLSHDDPRYWMGVWLALSSLGLKGIWFLHKLRGHSHLRRLGILQSLGFHNPRRAMCSLDSHQELSGKLLFIPLAHEWAWGRCLVFVTVKKGRSAFLRVEGEALRVSWNPITSKQRAVWPFSCSKVVKFGNPSSAPSNLFLAILGYMDISQHCGWRMRRTSDFFF